MKGTMNYSHRLRNNYGHLPKRERSLAARKALHVSIQGGRVSDKTPGCTEKVRDMQKRAPGSFKK
jgi:hypothetical protein